MRTGTCFTLIVVGAFSACCCRCCAWGPLNPGRRRRDPTPGSGRVAAPVAGSAAATRTSPRCETTGAGCPVWRAGSRRPASAGGYPPSAQSLSDQPDAGRADLPPRPPPRGRRHELVAAGGAVDGDATGPGPQASAGAGRHVRLDATPLPFLRELPHVRVRIFRHIPAMLADVPVAPTLKKPVIGVECPIRGNPGRVK
jgi:hypothetical protein